MNPILRPPDHLASVVGSGGKAVISTRKIGQSPHLALLPDESEVDIADVVRRTVESRATPRFAEGLRRESLGNAHEDSRGIFDVPRDTTVWSAEGVKVS